MTARVCTRTLLEAEDSRSPGCRKTGCKGLRKQSWPIRSLLNSGGVCCLVLCEFSVEFRECLRPRWLSAQMLRRRLHGSLSASTWTRLRLRRRCAFWLAGIALCDAKDPPAYCQLDGRNMMCVGTDRTDVQERGIIHAVYAVRTGCPTKHGSLKAPKVNSEQLSYLRDDVLLLVGFILG